MTEQQKLIVRGAAIGTKPVLSVFEAAVFLGLSESKIRKLIDERRIVARKLDGKILIPRQALLSLLEPEAPSVKAHLEKFLKGGIQDGK